MTVRRDYILHSEKKKNPTRHLSNKDLLEQNSLLIKQVAHFKLKWNTVSKKMDAEKERYKILAEKLELCNSDRVNLTEDLKSTTARIKFLENQVELMKKQIR